MSDASPLGIFVSDAAGNCIYTNATYQKISGLTFDQALGTRWSRAIHPEDRSRVLAEWNDAVHELASFQTEARFLRRDESVVWTRLNAVAIRNGTIARGRIQIVEDITERKSTELVLRASEMALFEEKERAQVTLNSIGDAVLSTDLAGKVTYLNLVA
ncbi:PAS domain-containing protein [Propionivibrio limicola]|uniref:PAS domain-containing protein n=1 Tax=Propionivibrio limicola TaxID=167645 RepID=UPI001B87748F|nr:PAS domain-containing protein [Propionivibrio limicola]